MKSVRKLLSLVLALAVVATFALPVFGEAMADKDIVSTLGLLNGEGAGLTDAYMAKTSTRLQAAIITLRLAGKEAEALAWTGAATFTDAGDVWWQGGKNLLAYLKANPDYGWIGYPDGSFKAHGTASAQMFYKVMLESLGYKQGVDFAWADVVGFAKALGLDAVIDVNPFTNADIATALVEALQTKVKGTDKTLITKLVEDGLFTAAVAAATGLYDNTLQVVSAAPISATRVLVAFNKAVSATDAIDVANYAVTGSGVITSAVVQADGKSVIFTTTNVLSGALLITIQPVVSAASTAELSPLFSTIVNYTDTTAPAVQSVIYPVFNKADVTFTEPIPAPGAITVFQAGVPIVAPVTWNAAKTVAQFNINAATEDAVLTVVIVGAQDAAGRLISPNPTTLTLVKNQTDMTAPTVVSSVAVSNKVVKVTFSEVLAGAPTITAGGAVPSATTLTTDDSIVFTATLTTPFAGIGRVMVAAGYADTSSNAGAAYTSGLLQFVADTAAPTLVSATVETISSVPYLVFRFNEDVAPMAVASTYAGTKVVNYIQSAVSGTFVVPVAYNNGTTTDAKAVMINITALTEGAYTVTVTNPVAKDLSDNTSAASFSISFTRGAVSTPGDTSAPTVNAVPAFTADNGYFDVVFSEAMDPATALNVANYTISGASIFSSAIFNADALHARLTVIPGTIAYTGNYAVAVSGAKDAAGNLMTAYSNIIVVEENIKPYATTAALVTTTTITVNFSEKVSLTANAFEYYIDGVLTAGATNPAIAVGAEATSVTVTIPAVTDLTKVYTIKLVGSGADELGNLLITGSTLTVAK